MAVLWQLMNLAHCRGVCHVILGAWLPATSVSDPVQCLSINCVPWLFLAPDCTLGSNSWGLSSLSPSGEIPQLGTV